MSQADIEYHRILEELLLSDAQANGRNGGVTTHFGTQLKFRDVGKNFPLLTTKYTHFKSIMIELLWFLKGDTNIKYLNDHDVKIWNEWADENGDLGPVYGSQWRSWKAWDGYGNCEVIDQITKVIKSLKEQPYGRRHIVSAWNPAEVDNMALPPCHTLFQFHVRPTGELDLQLYQRSADWFLGVPFNIASYALLIILVAREVGRVPGDFIHTFGNYHLYDNHRDQALTLLARGDTGNLCPNVFIDALDNVGIFDLEPKDIILEGYNHMGVISAPVSK